MEAALLQRSVWGLILSYFCVIYPGYIFYTWFFIYMVRVRGLTMAQGGVASSIPFVATVIASPLGGWFSDRAVVWLGRRRGRQVAVWIGVVCSASFFWMGAHSASNTLAIVLLAIGGGCGSFSVASWWATVNDMTRASSGRSPDS